MRPDQSMPFPTFRGSRPLNYSEPGAADNIDLRSQSQPSRTRVSRWMKNQGRRVKDKFKHSKRTDEQGIHLPSRWQNIFLMSAARPERIQKSDRNNDLFPHLGDPISQHHQLASLSGDSSDAVGPMDLPRSTFLELTSPPKRQTIEGTDLSRHIYGHDGSSAYKEGLWRSKAKLRKASDSLRSRMVKKPYLDRNMPKSHTPLGDFGGSSSGSTAFPSPTLPDPALQKVYNQDMADPSPSATQDSDSAHSEEFRTGHGKLDGAADHKSLLGRINREWMTSKDFLISKNLKGKGKMANTDNDLQDEGTGLRPRRAALAGPSTVGPSLLDDQDIQTLTGHLPRRPSPSTAAESARTPVTGTSGLESEQPGTSASSWPYHPDLSRKGILEWLPSDSSSDDSANDDVDTRGPRHLTLNPYAFGAIGAFRETAPGEPELWEYTARLPVTEASVRRSFRPSAPEAAAEALVDAPTMRELVAEHHAIEAGKCNGELFLGASGDIELLTPSEETTPESPLTMADATASKSLQTDGARTTADAGATIPRTSTSASSPYAFPQPAISPRRPSSAPSAAPRTDSVAVPATDSNQPASAPDSKPAKAEDEDQLPSRPTSAPGSEDWFPSPPPPRATMEQFIRQCRARQALERERERERERDVELPGNDDDAADADDEDEGDARDGVRAREAARWNARATGWEEAAPR